MDRVVGWDMNEDFAFHLKPSNGQVKYTNTNIKSYSPRTKHADTHIKSSHQNIC